ncbi:MAG: metal-dependent transcriptional regulator [Defluviitaleaceae bacterium]|nr:metal-dependent transcriptional regulator [Defluviitaleaceae bacterium]
MKIQTSAEDYLEAILVLSQKKGKVRSVDIAQHMSYSKPTISIMMKQFRENGYIEIDQDRNINLTDKGTEIAQRTYERHMLFAKFLIDIGVDEETAYADACKIEHSISEVSFERFRDFYDIFRGNSDKNGGKHA